MESDDPYTVQWLEIDENALIYNSGLFRNAMGGHTAMLGMVRGNACGDGLASQRDINIAVIDSHDEYPGNDRASICPGPVADFLRSARGDEARARAIQPGGMFGCGAAFSANRFHTCASSYFDVLPLAIARETIVVFSGTPEWRSQPATSEQVGDLGRPMTTCCRG